MSVNASDAAVWLRRFGTVAGPKQRLVCFPHAGGSASTFRSWRRGLPGDVELLTVRYPGREDRITEPFVEDMDEMAGEIAAELAPLLDSGLVLFGHSMGAALAFEVALLLEGEHGRGPAMVVVSGRSGPGTGGRDLPDDNDESVIDFAKSLGSLNSAAYDDEDLRPLLLPALRADLRMIKNHCPQPGRTIKSPLLIYVGDSDPDVTVSEAYAWSHASIGESSVKVFPGGHFYLVDSEAEVLDDLSARLRRARVTQPVLPNR
ncbi:thioesterase II family protein [Streptomyces griseus]|uniref:thioesterase II family protein n=1 Tax=Streptomyces griseus TaxID=1911 RepID=UPI00056105DA|nr:alpha/beta fold hydrolase [Streptomyces griseus]